MAKPKDVSLQSIMEQIPEDRIGIAIMIGKLRGSVVIRFCEAVKEFCMTPDGARGLARDLVEVASEVDADISGEG